MYSYDPELPHGFQEADFAQREAEAEARTLSRSRSLGWCHHTSGIGKSREDQACYKVQRDEMKVGDEVCTEACGLIMDEDTFWQAAPVRLIFPSTNGIPFYTPDEVSGGAPGRFDWIGD